MKRYEFIWRGRVYKKRNGRYSPITFYRKINSDVAFYLIPGKGIKKVAFGLMWLIEAIEKNKVFAPPEIQVDQLEALIG